MKKVKNTDLAVIYYGDHVVELFDIENRRTVKRKVYAVGNPSVSAVVYQKAWHLVCNMGKVTHGDIRY